MNNLFLLPMLLLEYGGFPINSFLNSTEISLIVNAMNKKGIANFEESSLEFSNIADGKDGERYYYYDLAGENGFLVLNQNQDIVYWKDYGDIPSIRSNESHLFYSKMALMDENGSVYSIEQEKLGDNDQLIFDPGSIAAQYPDYIEYEDILTILSTKYSGYDWQMTASGKLYGLNSGMNSGGYHQYYESIYKTYENGVWFGEGNCGIVSISNALQYYSRYANYSLLPNYSSFTAISPSVDEPSLMAQAASQTQSYIPISDPRSIHTITASVRSHAIEVGYITGGMDDYMTSYAFEETASDYGYQGTFQVQSSFSIIQIMDEIDSGRPLQFRTGNDVKYDGHGMMVTGYRLYEAEVWIQINPRISILSYASIPFLSVYDGHSVNERWYDLTSYGNLSSSYSRADSQTFATLYLEENA